MEKVALHIKNIYLYGSSHREHKCKKGVNKLRQHKRPVINNFLITGHFNLFCCLDQLKKSYCYGHTIHFCTIVVYIYYSIRKGLPHHAWQKRNNAINNRALP